MKKLLLLLLTILSLQAKAQFINLPDSNFRNVILSADPTLFNSSKQLDTNLAKTSILLTSFPDNLVNRNLKDLTGIEYFHKITYLNLGDNPIVTLNKLPPNCTYLQMFNCNLSSIPLAILNSTKLEDLDVSYNLLTNIPNLPNSLKGFDCSNNRLTTLPQLPINLEFLNCAKNNISVLPTLHNNLTVLICSYNKITNIPVFPVNIYRLECDNNLLTSIPIIPANAGVINFTSNLLTSFPNILRKAQAFDYKLVHFGNNRITTLPLIPRDSITYDLNIGYNPISDISTVFKLRLESLDVSGLPITRLPDTIKAIYNFICNHNQINKLPYISANSLSFAFTKFDTIDLKNIVEQPVFLDISFSNVTKLKAETLWLLGRKDISCLPFNENYFYIHVDSGQIKCLSSSFLNTWRIPNFSNTAKMDTSEYVKLLKNGKRNSWSSLHSFTIPICSPTNNVNNCNGSPTITGSIYIDENNNNIKDPTETFKANVPVRLKANNKTVTNINGAFTLIADSIGSQTVTVAAPRFFTAVPSTINFNFSKYDTLVNVPPIALQRTIIKDSLSTKITPINWAARPGFVYPYLVQYKNVGSTTINSTASLQYNNALLNYDSSSNSAVANTGTQLNLALNSFMPGQEASYVAYFRVKPSGSLLGQVLNAYSNITGGAATAIDSTRIIIGGSYDPNDKLATPQLSTTQVAEGQFINYTVRFQ
ncbi:MAG: hypothetical protein ACOVO1_10255, partial [Chitinophagaceae bacterium]